MARTVTLTSPLGEKLQFWRMTASEGLGRMFEYELDVLSDSPDLAPADLLGKPVTVGLTVDADRQRHFNGLVVRVAQGAPLGKKYAYRLSVRPWLWLLSRTSDCKIFQEKSVPDVIDEVFSDEAFKAVELKLTGSYKPWTYCAQYRETDFNFVSRLMEQEGIYYYFEHSDGEHRMVLCDGPGAHDPIEGGEKVRFDPIVGQASTREDHIATIGFSQEIQPGVVAMREYDFVKPGTDMGVTRKPEHAPGHKHDGYEVFDYPGAYDDSGEGESYAAVRIEELAARVEVFNGSGNERDIAVGRRFTLEKHPGKQMNAEYLVTATQIRIEEGQYEAGHGGGTSFAMSFTAIRHRQTFRPTRVTPKPMIVGVQTAVVTGPAGDEIYTDKHGRVKVQFHWDRYGKKDENSSCFVRVAYPMAGKGWGMVSIPRIGHEVVVSFEEGDPDRPIITGSVFNGENPGPFGTPGKAMVSGVKTNTHKGKGFNEMSMDDTAGKELINIHGQYDMVTVVEHDQKNTVNNDFTEVIKNTTKITVTQGTYSHDVATGTATYHVKGALKETYENTQDTTVTGNLTVTSTGGVVKIEAGSKNLHIKAATDILLECGASTIQLFNDGRIEIKGKAVTIDGTDSVNIHGKSVRSTADAEHETEGNIVKSNGKATNTVQGGMVMLNP